MKILYKLTTRERPELALRAIKSMVELSKSKDYKVLLSLDWGGGDYAELLKYLKDNNVEYQFAIDVSKGKIGSINRDMDLSGDWDILVNLSDDQVFVMDGFDEVIREAFATKTSIEPFVKPVHLETNLDQFIHFPDGNRKDLATMSIMGRKYYERDGHIYDPRFDSFYCDDYAQMLAKHRGCYKYVDVVIANHLHPNYGKAESDKLYVSNSTFEQTDLNTYRKLVYALTN